MSHKLNQNQSNEQSQQSPRYSLKNFEKKDISEYPYPNKEIETLCTNFVCNLFNINPKSYESYGQNNFGVRKISENKIELKSENSPKKYSIESSPISIHKNQEKEYLNNNNINLNNNINNNNKNNNSSKSESNYDESDKENNSYLSNTPRNIKIVSNNVNNISNDNMKNICKDFIEDIFAQENEKYTKFNKYGDELNKIGLSDININNNINININIKKKVPFVLNFNQKEKNSVLDNININNPKTTKTKREIFPLINNLNLKRADAKLPKLPHIPAISLSNKEIDGEINNKLLDKINDINKIEPAKKILLNPIKIIEKKESKIKLNPIKSQIRVNKFP